MVDVRTALFLPTTESHMAGFLGVRPALQAAGISTRLLIVDDAIASHRRFDFAQVAADDVMRAKPGANLSAFARSALDEAGPNTVVVVGNDTGRARRSVLRALSRRGTPVVLQQDGWLDAESILRLPDADGLRRVSPLRQAARVAASSRMSPVRTLVNGALGQLTDHFLVYSERAAEEFRKAGVPAGRIHVVGSPRHQVMRQEMAVARAAAAAPAGYVLATTYHRRPDLFEAMEQAVSWVAEESAATSIPVTLKRHPAEVGEWAAPTPPPLRDVDPKTPLHRVLAGTEALITFGSTAAIDALACGIPAVQLMPPVFETQMSRGYQPELAVIRSHAELGAAFAELPDWARQRANVAPRELIADADPAWDSATRTTDVLVGIFGVSS